MRHYWSHDDYYIVSDIVLEVLVHAIRKKKKKKKSQERFTDLERKKPNFYYLQLMYRKATETMQPVVELHWIQISTYKNHLSSLHQQQPIRKSIIIKG